MQGLALNFRNYGLASLRAIAKQSRIKDWIASALIGPRNDARKFSFCFFILFIMFFLINPSIHADEANVALDKAPVDVTDLASLQRGAQIFMNHCSGCHSLKYVRYSTLSKEIGIVNKKGEVLDNLVKEDLMFVGDKITDPILTAMNKEDAAKWFGIAPPDLSLVTQSRGADWVYTYLRSFYKDDKKTWGVNNRVFPDVAMPNVLEKMQERLTPQEFDAKIGDLVNFLAFVGDPTQITRQHIGAWVLVFLGVFLVFACLLKREYWKDVK